MYNNFEMPSPLPITKKGCILFAITALSASGALADHHLKEPVPALMIFSEDLPQEVQKDNRTEINQPETAESLYHKTRKELDLSHSTMALWLGLKRRSLYNWLKSPNSSTKQQEVEERLYNLSLLIRDMEPEHIKLTNKIAFSPIYGDKKFGEAILKGASHETLIDWYDNLFDRFEAYRKSIT